MRLVVILTIAAATSSLIRLPADPQLAMSAPAYRSSAATRRASSPIPIPGSQSTTPASVIVTGPRIVELSPHQTPAPEVVFPDDPENKPLAAPDLFCVYYKNRPFRFSGHFGTTYWGVSTHPVGEERRKRIAVRQRDGLCNPKIRAAVEQEIKIINLLNKDSSAFVAIDRVSFGADCNCVYMLLRIPDYTLRDWMQERDLLPPFATRREANYLFKCWQMH